ncbi:MAG: MBL fold metallo-hydrolase [Victivallales bacterium]|jgi:phosphoribosyl 1,2-cyclic phosphodiesterase
MRFGITALGSGSRGNAILLHTEEEGILVDAGFSRKELIARLASCGIEPGRIKALLISHEHGDHVNGARLFSDDYGIPTYLTTGTGLSLDALGKLGKKRFFFETGSVFEVKPFKIRPFSVPHDAADPVGFVVSLDSTKVGIATDLGHINSLCLQRLRDCDALILECNHDVEMQRRSERSLKLQMRVLGKRGHLNNDDAMSALDSLVTEKTRFLFLVHLSSDCNEYSLVQELGKKKLADIGRQDIRLTVVSQDRPSETIWIL